MGKINYKLINFAIIIVILFLIFKTLDNWIAIFYFLKKIITPFLISFSIAYILDAISNLFIKKRINKKFACVITLIIILTIIFICLYFSIPVIVKQIVLFSNNLNYFFNTSKLDLSFIKDIIFREINKIITSFSSFKIMQESISTISNTIIIIILSVCFLFKMDNIKKDFKNYLDKKNKLRLFLCFKEIDNNFNNYIKGLSIIIILEMIEYYFIYLIVGHPNYLLLGFLAGITTIIPYFGGLFTNIIALITALSISKRLFIICCIIAVIMPIIDGYIIDPKIYNKTNKISSITIIISIIITSSIFGFIGVLIAIPFYILVDTFIKYYKDDIRFKRKK